MYPRSIGSHDNLPLVPPRIGISLVVLLSGGIGILILAWAIPNLPRQFGQPCGACYLGAFGPPLEPYGHLARLDSKPAIGPVPPPIPAEAASVADPPQARLNGGLLWIAANEGTALSLPVQIVSGRAGQDIGETGQGIGTQGIGGGWGIGETGSTDGGATRLTNPGTRNAQRFAAFEPTGPMAASEGTKWVTWDAWPERRGAPDAAPTQPGDGDGRWLDPRGTEPAGYRVLGRDGHDPIGLTPVSASADSFMPHWRVAVQKDLERHFLQLATSGTGTGPADSFAAIAAAGPNPGITEAIKAAGGDPPQTPVRGMSLSLGAGFSLLNLDNSRPPGSLDAGTPYRFAAAVTPAIQYFPVAGPGDAVRYFWPDVRPGSSGVIAGLAYAPPEQPMSAIQLLNLRFAAQYAANKEFSGAVRGAGAGNTLVLTLWGALHF